MDVHLHNAHKQSRQQAAQQKEELSSSDDETPHQDSPGSPADNSRNYLLHAGSAFPAAGWLVCLGAASL